MPNKTAAIKDLRKNQKRALKNARMKTHVKALTAQVKLLVKEGKKKELAEVANKLQQVIDKAAKTFVLPKNTASRKVSSLHKLVNGKK